MNALRRTLVLASAAALTATAACGGSKTVTEQTPPHLVSGDVDRSDPTSTPSAADAAIGMQAFAHRLLSEHPDLLDGANGVVSPASIETAFAMLRAGAEGETAEQIDDVFGFPATELGPAYNYLTDQWTPGDGKGAPELSVANSLFVDDGFALRQSFLDALARDFGAGVQTVDFARDAADVINAWVKEQTRGRIDKLFDELSPQTKLVLANAVYLKAKWATPFRSDSTRDAAFRRVSGGPVQVPFMHQTESFDYAEGAGWSAVRLPYKGDELSMWVLLPDAVEDPVSLLDPAVLAEATRSAAPHQVELALPKWDLQTDAPLTDVLPAMGMPRAFSDAAQFDGIAGTGLKIDQVMHRADITVDEKGTEAAAVTGIAMELSAVVPIGDPVAFDADHPFAFVVMHDATRAPLFEGVVGDPSTAQ